MHVNQLKEESRAPLDLPLLATLFFYNELFKKSMVSRASYHAVPETV